MVIGRGLEEAKMKKKPTAHEIATELEMAK
eukprot:gene11509-biopygen3582